MKFVCISDLHGLQRKKWCIPELLPDGDVLIISGDLTNYGEINQLVDFNSFLGEINYTKDRIIVIAGNHDFSLERERDIAESTLSNCTYLRDSEVNIDGIKIYGSPWTPKFFNWAFMVDSAESLTACWEQIPLDADILVTHGPPFGILDKTKNGDYAGCSKLRKRIKEVKPKYHIFGHIHEGYGKRKVGDTIFINASTCNERYKPINDPIIFHYDKLQERK